MDAALIARPSGASPLLERFPPIVELSLAVGLLELELWYLRVHGPAWLNVLIFASIVATMVFSVERRRRMGVIATTPRVNARRAWVEVSLACVTLSTVLMIAAGFVGDSNETYEFVFLDKPPLKLATWLLGKFAAALAQQLALQLFLWPNCLELTRSRPVAMVAAAAIFGLIHLPSPTLVAITTLAGVVWIALYRRTGRLAPLVISHMILATLAHGGLPERLTFDMRVGQSATVDMKRFEDLNDPHNRLINRRLKQNRASQRILSSADYYQRQGSTPAGLIRGLYRDVLERTANDADVAFWLGRGLSNDDLVSSFLASDEFAAIREKRRLAGLPDPPVGVRR
jgi:membrane protease YdiL (CAAX protease family)